VLCYNKTLADRLRQLMAEQGVDEHVHVRNFHGWCRDQLIHYHCGMPTATDKNEYASELVERLRMGMEHGQIPAGQYGAVLVDEGHDFEAEWLRIVVKMVDAETNSLLLLYDDAQSIYKRHSSFSFRSVGIQAQGRTTILRLNYRNTAEVLSVAYKFAEDLLKPEASDEDGIPLIQPEAADRHGPEPELARFATLRDEAAHVARIFTQLSADGYAWSDMAVVYRAGFIENEIKTAFDRAGIPSETLTRRPRDQRLGSRPNKVSLVTFHSSKGLEYPVVAIPGVGFLPNAHESEADEVRLAYVAMTRATERLILSCHRESKFVQRLVAAGVRYT
jgi:superfamily I DNA/RNA helicase